MTRRRQLKKPQIEQQIEKDESYYDQRAPDGWPVRDIPRPLIDVKIGDAAAGQSLGRRIHLFGSVAADGGENVFDFTQQIAIQTARSTDTRPRLFHVSFFGNERQRFEPAAGPGLTPLPESQIQNITGPNTTQVQGRILIQDESGGRILDVDTLGTASIDVYAFAITVFALVPQNFYSVDTTSAQIIQPNNPSRNGLVVDSMFGARIIPISLNGTSLPKQITRRVRLGAAASDIVAIPPGSRFVEVVAPTPAIAGATTASFVPTIEPAVFAASGITLGQLSFIAAESTTRKQMIPNALGILLANGSGVAANYQLTFEVDR